MCSSSPSWSSMSGVRRRHQEELRHHREVVRHRHLGHVRGLEELDQPLSVLLSEVIKSRFEDESQVRRLEQRLAQLPLSPQQVAFITSELLNSSNVSILSHLLATKPSPALFALTANLALFLDDQMATRLARSLGPPIVSTLSPTSGSTRMKPTASVIVAHLSKDHPRASQVLVNQGCLEALTDCMESMEVAEMASNALYLLLIHRPQIEEPILADILDVIIGKLQIRGPIFVYWTTFVLVSHWPSLHNEIHDLNKLIGQCVDVCTYEIFKKADSRPLVKIVTPIVRILANLCAGSRATEAVISLINLRSGCDLVAIFTALLATNYTHLCQETLWLVTNVINCDDIEVQERLVELQWTDRLELHVQQAWQRTQPWNLQIK